MTNGKIKLAALAIGLAAAMPLAAQTTGSPGGQPATTVQQDDGFDWGWLGLLGLIGLAGLRRRDDGRTTTTTGNRL